jgi:hypothetical protein
MDLTPEQRAEVDELRTALLQEFHESQEGKAKQSALTDIEDLKGDMLSALRHVLKHSANEALKAKVAMWGYALLVDIGKGSNDPLARLLEEAPRPSSHA